MIHLMSPAVSVPAMSSVVIPEPEPEPEPETTHCPGAGDVIRRMFVYLVETAPAPKFRVGATWALTRKHFIAMFQKKPLFGGKRCSYPHLHMCAAKSRGKGLLSQHDQCPSPSVLESQRNHVKHSDGVVVPVLPCSETFLARTRPAVHCGGVPVCTHDGPAFPQAPSAVHVERGLVRLGQAAPPNPDDLRSVPASHVPRVLGTAAEHALVDHEGRA